MILPFADLEQRNIQNKAGESPKAE